MTANQISYARLKEEERSHRENERANLISAEAKAREVAVKENEFAQYQALIPLQQYEAQTRRMSAQAQAAQANVAAQRANEDIRHNEVSEQQGWFKTGIEGLRVFAGALAGLSSGGTV
jgi:multidrug efflux pump subunit AcrA (membrane-fusion protein)